MTYVACLGRAAQHVVELVRLTVLDNGADAIKGFRHGGVQEGTVLLVKMHVPQSRTGNDITTTSDRTVR